VKRGQFEELLAAGVSRAEANRIMIARIDEQMPMRVLIGEVGNATDDAASPTSFSFDQHGHVLNAELAVAVIWMRHRKKERQR